jgi:hypothetical protein
LKHEGFSEEREWRVIHAPNRMPSDNLESSIETIAGVPQRIYKIPLRSDPSAGLTGLDLDQLIDRIIIGPTQFPWVMFEAFSSALTDAGVKNSASRIAISQIPVRT